MKSTTSRSRLVTLDHDYIFEKIKQYIRFSKIDLFLQLNPLIRSLGTCNS